MHEAHRSDCNIAEGLHIWRAQRHRAMPPSARILVHDLHPIPRRPRVLDRHPDSPARRPSPSSAPSRRPEGAVLVWSGPYLVCVVGDLLDSGLAPGLRRPSASLESRIPARMRITVLSYSTRVHTD